MTIEAARAQLAVLIAKTSQPVVTDEEIDVLLDGARRPDANGLVYGDDDYSPTWNLNAAAAAAWSLKAGRCADLVDMSVGDLRMSNSKLFEHCNTKAAEFRSMLIGSIPVSSSRNVETIPWP